MASVNKVILVGNLGRDPESRFLASGEAVCNFSIATSEQWKNKNGEKQEATEWHRISFFGKVAEVCAKYLTKGSTVYIEGSIRTRKWTDKDGTEKYSTEIKGERMQMLGGRVAQSDAEETPAPAPEKKAPSKFDSLEDQIPF